MGYIAVHRGILFTYYNKNRSFLLWIFKDKSFISLKEA